ncbi:molybdate ABC transporter substrate-binding protein [Roseibium sp.]|uniref:molybdate ABC transporter substrate-binding protein n=2 Tax=Roseibium sp. TaxID=1936156 RepID=UPI003D0A8CFC
MFRRLFFLIALLPVFPAVALAQSASLTVFAAASLKEAMEQVGTAFEEETGTRVVFSFAGTGTLARQVEAGSPAEVFLSADAAWMDYVRDRDAVKAETIREIASNALVLIGPAGSPPIQLTAGALEERLEEGRLAIADPDTVPAGRYGAAALESLGLWQAVSGRLAPMENVRVALAAVARGDTPVGLVYRTDATVEPDVAVLAEFPQASHPRIQYLAALTSTQAHPAAAAFLAYLEEARAREILHSLGFLTDKVK